MKKDIKQILAVFIIVVMGLQYLSPVHSLATEVKEETSVVEENLTTAKPEEPKETANDQSEVKEDPTEEGKEKDKPVGKKEIDNIEEEIDESLLGKNPDGLSDPKEIEAPEIREDLYPENLRENRMDPNSLQPGGTKLSKIATPVEGKINTWDITLRVEGRDIEETSDIVLVIDKSGSMDGTRLSSAKSAANEFVDTLLKEGNTTTRIAVVSFNNTVTTHGSGLTYNGTVLKDYINDLTASSGTFTQAGIRQARAILANSNANHKNIVLLSDGVPTYSYGLNNPDNYLTGNQTNSSMPQNAFNYSSTVGDGTNMLYQYNWWSLFNPKYYNHGNSTIAESRYAKDAGNTLYTIGLETDNEGNSVLNASANPGKNYTGSESDLDQIFATIAGDIEAAVKNGSVIDNMAEGFEVSNPTDIVVSQGTATYDEVNKRINWNSGTLTVPVSPGSDVKFAELKYRVEINDDIIGAPNEDGLYKTNDGASITYTDSNGQQQTKEFESPKVNPLFLIIKKNLLDSSGNEIANDERIFNINVTSPKGHNEVYDLKSGEVKTITNLRLIDDYTVSEVNAEGYDTELTINGENTDKFKVATQEDPDINVAVTNKEKDDGKLTVKKVFENESSSIFNIFLRSIQPSFKFKVTGVNGYSEEFELKAGEEKVLENLTYGEYKVEETDTKGFDVHYDPSDEVTLSFSEKEKTVIVTNSPKIDDQTVNIEGKKVWVGGPEEEHVEVEMQLLRNGEEIDKEPDEVTNENPSEFIYKWNDLTKYDENGVEYTYTIKEKVELNGYIVTLSEDGLTVTNTYNLTSVEGQKTWKDKNDQDGKRPGNIVVILNKTINGELTEVERQTVTPDENGDWKYKFTNLPKNSDGEKIVYSVAEVVPEGYTHEINDFNITNSYTPKETDITVVKNWTDAENQDGIRPTSIEVELYADGELKDTKTLDKAMNWTYQWTGLDKFKAGDEIAYTVKEKTVVEDYETSEPVVDEETRTATITNTHKPYVVDVEGQKTWKDNNDQDGKRPENIVVILNKTINGELAEVERQTVTPDENGDWNYKFANLPKNSDGEEIVYSVAEVVPEGYTHEINDFNIVNSYKPEETDITVVKNWTDAENQDGIRPTSIEVELYADGELKDTKTLDKAMNWTYQWTGLDKFKAGDEIAYTVKEKTVVEDYETSEPVVDEETRTATITNTHKPYVVDVEGQKTWDDKDDQDGKRPKEIVVELHKTVNGVTEKVDEKTVTLDDNWSYKFENLPKYEKGTLIVYSVKEQIIDGYTSKVEGNNITNSYKPEETQISVEKNWEDENDQDGKRPTSIEVELYADGELKDTQTLDEANSWKYDWTGLAKKEAGKVVTYTVEEKDVPEGYTETQVTNNETNTVTITNKHIPEVTELEGQKTWKDKNDQDGKRPESIVVELHKTVGGETKLVDTVEVTLDEDDDWKYKFNNLPVYEAKEVIEYSIKEQVPEGYTSEPSKEGYDITNHYTPEETELEVVKSWNDENDKDKIRPSSVTVELYSREKDLKKKVN